MSQPVDHDAILDALRPIIDPDLGRDIVSLGFVKDVVIDGGGLVTLDGGEPSAASPRYEAPIALTDSVVVRVLVLRDGEPFIQFERSFQSDKYFIFHLYPSFRMAAVITHLLTVVLIELLSKVM